MKQIPSQFTTNDHVFTQVKRGSKAAIFRRESTAGQILSFDVFALLRDSDGNEVYPQAHALSKWAWAPAQEHRAKTYFDRIEKGDMTVPDFNPHTSEIIRPENEPTLAEVMAGPDVELTEIPLVPTIVPEAVVVAEPTPTEHSVETAVSLDEVVPAEPTIEPEVVVASEPVPMEDPTAIVVEPTVETADPTVVTPTADGGAVVTVAKVRKSRVTVTMKIPDLAEFTQAQFAEANGLPARGVVYGRIQTEIEAGRIVLKEMRQSGKGRPTAFYSAAVAVTAAV
jgi:hypothetical protein